MEAKMRNYKDDFPLLKSTDIAYLDNAATEQRPSMVLDAVRDFYEHSNANPLRGLYSLAYDATEHYENAREKVRDFIGASKTSEIVFTRNTTESINLVAYSYGLNNLHEGDEILITISEHHSNILPWQMVASKTGATLKYLECEPDGSYPLEKLRAAVTEKTKLAAMAQVSNVLGSENPVRELIQLVHKNGGVVLVDAAQSAPHMAIDVTELDCDFLAFSGHKMMAPMGIGVLYGKESLLEKMPPFLSGGEMIEYVTRDSATYAELPHKFEAGTVSAGDAVGLAAAIDYINSIGMDAIHSRETELTKLLFEQMQAIPHVNIIGSSDYRNHSGIVSFTVDGVHPHDISAILDEDEVAIRAGHHCAQPLHTFLGVRSSARASLAFYNDESDIDRFIQSLKTLRRRMGLGD